MAQFDLVVRNGVVVTGSGRRDADIGVRDGRITAIDARGQLAGTGNEEFDATGLYVLPGVIDEHVHFREPGLEHEETWLTGSRAAVMGGVTTVLEMPNTIPPTDTVERVRDKLALAAAAAYCDYGVLGLLGESTESAAEIASSGRVVGLKAFLGPTTGDLRAPDADGLRRALRAARESGLRVAFHAEDREIIERSEAALRAAGRTDAAAHLEARPATAEVVAIDRIGRILLDMQAGGHILHVSSADGLAAIEKWRDRGAELTCEVTPHHLFLERDVYETAAGIAKVNPPIRGGRDAAELRDALADGRIDTVGSDHAPHLAAEKRAASIWEVPSGFAGVETLVPLFLTHSVNSGRMTLEQFVRVSSEGPAKAWSLYPRKGAIEIGSDADLTILDLNRDALIRAQDLHGKNNLSPFEGEETKGAAVATIVRGHVVMRDGELVGTPGIGRSVV